MIKTCQSFWVEPDGVIANELSLVDLDKKKMKVFVGSSVPICEVIEHMERLLECFKANLKLAQMFPEGEVTPELISRHLTEDEA